MIGGVISPGPSVPRAPCHRLKSRWMLSCIGRIRTALRQFSSLICVPMHRRCQGGGSVLGGHGAPATDCSDGIIPVNGYGRSGNGRRDWPRGAIVLHLDRAAAQGNTVSYAVSDENSSARRVATLRDHDALSRGQDRGWARPNAAAFGGGLHGGCCPVRAFDSYWPRPLA